MRCIKKRRKVNEKRALIREPQRSGLLARPTTGQLGILPSRPSSSWSRRNTDDTTGFGSWSEELEEAASRRVLDHWRLIERTLHDEDGQLQAGPLRDECQQWRVQLAHLRLVGRAAAVDGSKVIEGSTGTTAAAESSGRNSSILTRDSNRNGHRMDELDDLDNGGLFSKEASFHSFNQQSQKQAKEEVLEHIIEFICKELAELEAEKLAEQEEEENENELKKNFDECLKIAPAPTCTGKNPLASNGFHYKVESIDSIGKDDLKANDDRDPRTRRNKLGTVFNERVIVSPVPYVVTTRESFSTLRKTPILYAEENNGAPDILRSGSRRENTRRKLSLTGRTSLIAAPHVQPSWNNTPVCPTIWPKNVKLTPIDTSRLPSSKKRSTKTADSLPPRRNRHSLSPISRSIQPISPHSCIRKDNHLASLEVRGSQIVAQERIWHARNTAKTANIGSNLYVPERQV